MNRIHAFVVLLTLTLFSAAAPALAETQLGASYGKEFRGNKNLEQIEAFVRFGLPYKSEWGTVAVRSGLELAGAIIHEDKADNDDAGRFSLMPQIVMSPNEVLHFIAGFGAGFMVGETEFTDHNLGGSFCLLSKVGLQLVLAKTVGLEYTFYHQSNAGIYDYNASLNMHQIALTFHF